MPTDRTLDHGYTNDVVMARLAGDRADRSGLLEIDPDWQPQAREQNQALLNSLVLADAFWNLCAVNPEL